MALINIMWKTQSCQIFRSKIISRHTSMLSLRENISNGLKLIRNNNTLIKYNGPTAEEVSKDFMDSIANKVCLITGANHGIGLEVTRCLNSCDCTILMACRNTYDANGAANNVCKNVDRLQYYELNLASLDSVRECSKSLIKTQKNIDIVILNAATFGLPWTLTEDSLETTFQVNFMSQYYLLLSLEKILAPDARVVFTSSESHKNVKLPFNAEILPCEEHFSLPKDTYTSIRAYNLSKLCGVLAMHYLHYRWLRTDKSVFCAHPGTFVKTGLCRNWWPFEALYTFMVPFSKTISQAASTVVYCATATDLVGHSGLYFKDCKHAEESEIAKNTYLSYRIHDMACDILRDRNVDCDSFVKLVEGTCDGESAHPPQLDEQMVSNC